MQFSSLAIKYFIVTLREAGNNNCIFLQGRWTTKQGLSSRWKRSLTLGQEQQQKLLRGTSSEWTGSKDEPPDIAQLITNTISRPVYFEINICIYMEMDVYQDITTAVNQYTLSLQLQKPRQS